MNIISIEQRLFQAIEIKLVLETPQDLRAFFELGNCSPFSILELINQSEELTEESINKSFLPLFNELKKYYGM
ncbi:hypothetical protein [Mucilaginibacter sp. 10I4]|uniref:hypothetical protein n=1 Tax=Mucilaginibacter sp. 10I4 TaxID=3048580 RepID=UPI002B2272B2|nr:hypothetical protein [Mucilaginibacter sp. 10I4]MEB0262912.1 hypothetical protein [Mucilaginibacter sp. 10I4]